MQLEDYNEYYINGSDHYLIPKEAFIELFNEMQSWKDDFIGLRDVEREHQEINGKLREKIDKATEFIEKRMIVEQAFNLDIKQCDELLEILKGERNNMKNADLTYGGEIEGLYNIFEKKIFDIRYTVEGKTGKVTTTSILINPDTMEMITFDYQDFKALIEGKNE